MKIKISNIALAAAMLTVASCSEHWTPPTGSDGSLALGSMIVDVKENANVIVSSGSRAAADVNSFQVTIYDKTGAEAGSWTYGQMPEIVPLAAGDGYVVKVKSHDVEKAAWEQPYYYGESKAFTIEKNKITEVGTVTAEFKSIKVTVEFSDALKAIVDDDVKVVIEANDEGLITFTKKEVEDGSAAYFEAVDGSTTMVAHFIGSISGNAIDNKVPFTDVTAGQHRIVRYGIQIGPDVPEPDGSITPGGISLDTEIVEVDIDGNTTVKDPNIDPSGRPGYEDSEKPGPDDPTPPTPGGEAATFKSETLDTEGGINYSKDWVGDAIVTIVCPEGFAKLEVVIDSEGLTPDVLEGVGLAKEFDLANPGSLAEGLEGLGFPIGDAVLGKTTVDFNITDFVPLLNIYPGKSDFIITVTDSKGATSTLTLKFVS